MKTDRQDTAYLKEIIEFKAKRIFSAYEIDEINKEIPIINDKGNIVIGEIDIVLKNKNTGRLSIVEVKKFSAYGLPKDTKNRWEAVKQDPQLSKWVYNNKRKANTQLNKILKINNQYEHAWILLVDKWNNVLWKNKKR